MNVRYFENEMRYEALTAEIASWLGTKYRHLGRSKGGGVDCGNFVGLVLKNLGIISTVEEFYYSRDWYVHGNVDLLVEGFARHVKLYGRGICAVLCQGDQALPGDILCMRLYNDTCPAHHAAICLKDNEIADSLEEIGVSKHDWNYKWRARTIKFFRIFEERA
jgi:cell wall-associated NlpC family hydrolase